MKLPDKIYLSRAEVLACVGGRVQLDRLEAEGQLERHYPAGIKHARYIRAEVKRVLDDLKGQDT